MSNDGSSPSRRSRRSRLSSSRRVLPVFLLAFFALAASAQAHNLTASAACTPGSGAGSGNAVTINWLDFANPAGPDNGGENTPTWQIVYTPTGGGAPVTLNGSVTFPLDSDSVTVPVPSGAANVIASSSWTASQTSDGNASSYSIPLTVPNCLASPAIVTTASAGVPAGGTISDSAVLSGGRAPTGTITFNLYAASDTTCSKSLATGTATVTGNGTYASPAVIASSAGSYQWTASYSGDANNTPVADACGEPAEQVVVSPAPPSIVTTASPGVAVGGTISDQAVLSGGSSPTGTITFDLYATSDTTCSKLLAAGTVTVTGNGSYASPAVTENAAGSYQWTATYSGDASNIGATDGCGQAAEQVVVSKAAPAIVTTASAGCKPTSTTTTCKLTDHAVLSGGSSPTGTITFSLYPSGTTCTKALGTVTATVKGNGTYTSPAVSEIATGSYQWTASYSGDANNAAASEPCHVTQEQVPGQQVKPVCTANPHLVGVFGKVGGTVTAHVTALGVKSVTFYLDGRKVATLTTPHHGLFTITIKTSHLKYGVHRLKATTKMTQTICKPVSLEKAFIHPAPHPVPQPTG